MESSSIIVRYAVEQGDLEAVRGIYGGHSWQNDGSETDVRFFDGREEAEEFFELCAGNLRSSWKAEGMSRPGAGCSGMAECGMYVELLELRYEESEVEEWGEDAEAASEESLRWWQYTSDDYDAEYDIVDLADVADESLKLEQPNRDDVLWLYVEESEDGDKVASCAWGTSNSGFAYFDKEGNRHSAAMSIRVPMTAGEIAAELDRL